MTQHSSTKKAVFELVQILVFAFVLSWGLRSTVVEAMTIPSGSMLPTIQLQDRVMVDKIAYKFSGINRQDVIVFHPPKDVNNPTGDLWIKRVIGLPGDTVQIKDGKVFVNGKALNEPYEMAKPDYDYGPIKVPADSYFVLGDNRNDSLDSHIWGVLPAKNVVGRAMFKYWPPNDFGSLAK
ncbi:Peptidase S24/S26, beta-ribbon domain protein [Acididesulfobacillus acetoxydans]|uniref:Signal peptidase I n=1 Tax=Acididesulfobacillus acetoxydans TaxID=1561005 RepID=A0A8S0X055_9FIRM|nr:signal peptidase I [Acididesulfobacillus acetoxydans]CAA7602381.1 Peptidase S24/S26, beta-ribbon domain protein [Acididesulfobacillus acetoxydans]CEJ08384.1 Signal peptidase I [Acididesulfobacillus acetoxydans]